MRIEAGLSPDQVTEGMRLYRPYGGAEKMLYDRSTEVLLDGPAGTGKSRAVIEKLFLCLHKWPNSRAALVRKTRASLTETGLVTLESKVLPAGHPAVRRGLNRGNRTHYDIGEGSELILAGMDKPSKILSAEFDLICVQQAEELTLTDWETLTTRLRNGKMPYQQIFGDCNPGPPTHWIKQRESSGVLKLIPSRHEDNPVLWDHTTGTWTNAGVSYIAVLDKLTGPRRERLRHGRWVGAEGVVYEAFDTALHLIDRFEIPREWRRIRVIDFGYTNPFVCQWFAIDPDGRMYMYREIYHTQRLVQDHARQIAALSRKERIEATIADHDAEDRATLHYAGIGTIPAWKSVSDGIQAVQSRLQKDGTGRPRIFFLRDSLVERDVSLAAGAKPSCTVEEFDGYIWAPSPDGKPVKDEPLKVNDHGVDALRYACAYVDCLAYGGMAVTADDILTIAR
jgi:phage terminase large subunit